MINWVIIFLYFSLLKGLDKRFKRNLVQTVTKIVFYFKTKKLLVKYFPINEIFNFV